MFFTVKCWCYICVYIYNAAKHFCVVPMRKTTGVVKNSGHCVHFIGINKCL